MSEFNFNLPPLEVRRERVREIFRWWAPRPKSETDGSEGILVHSWRDGVEYLYTSGRTRCLGRADEYCGGQFALGPEASPEALAARRAAGEELGDILYFPRKN